MKKIINEPNLIKVDDSRAVLNMNIDELKQYREKKKNSLTIEKLNNEVEVLKKKLDEIIKRLGNS